MYYTQFKTHLCEIILVGDERGLTNLHLNSEEGKRIFYIADDWVLNDDFFKEEINQIQEYMQGKRTLFNLKLNPKGTEFQKRVWNELSHIPYGETRTYKQIATKLGNEKASRAVGMANSKNPIALIIPCHRVIGVNGRLTGFAHGLAIKEKMLTLEEQKEGKK